MISIMIILVYVATNAGGKKTCPQCGGTGRTIYSGHRYSDPDVIKCDRCEGEGVVEK